MKFLNLKRTTSAAAVSILAVSAIAGPALALSTNQTAAQQQRLATIKAKGDQEINRRLTTLSSLTTKINSLTKVSASDKSSLNSEVSSELNGLTTLKSQLDADTTVAAAGTDAKSVISDYRVYALVVPKVWLIKTADDQQAVQAKLAALATKLQTRITDAKNSGKDVTSLQSSLDDLNSQMNTAQGISSSVETSVLALQPSDYNSDHTIVSGYRTQLQTAHSDDQTAVNDARTIVNSLKNL